MGKLKFKTENVPLIATLIIVVILIISVIANTISNQTSTASVDSNYQVSGMVDKTKFAIMRAYYKDDMLLIESTIDTSEDASILNKSIYYKLGTDTSNKVIKQGFLTKQIQIQKKDISSDGNIRIQIYGVNDESELKTSKMLYQVIIDKDEIVDYINIVDKFKNYDSLNTNEKQKLINYIDLNYINKRLMNYYSSDIQNIFKPYLKAKQEDKQLELEKIRNLILDKYNYYKKLANLINIDFDKLINNSLELEDNYYSYTAIQKSIEYVNEQIKQEINKLELEAIDKGINLTKYDQEKNNYPLQNQYEYLIEQIKNTN